MIWRFLRWWRAELMAMVPARVRSRLAGSDAAVCLRVGRERVEQLDTFDDAGEVLGIWPLDDAAASAGGAVLPADLGSVAARLRFEPGLALERQVELPLATEENLGAVLGFEMERLTPFRRGDVYWRHRVAGRDAKAGRLLVDLFVARRDLVDRALARVGLVDVHASAAAGGDATDGRLELTFAPAASGRMRAGWLGTALLVLNCALLGGLVSVILDHQSQSLRALELEVREVSAAAEHTHALRDRLSALQASARFLGAERSARAPVVVLLEELSEVLPDGTWLTRLEMRPDGLHLHGVSSSASGLIALLDESPLLTGARFASPVVRDARSGRDRFHVAANVAPAEVSQ